LRHSPLILQSFLSYRIPLANGALIAHQTGVTSCADDLPNAVKRALEEIVRYMISRPDAKDTVKGIHDWWLPVNRDDCSLDEVKQAVETLVHWGWLTEHRLAEQIVVYGPSQAGLQKGFQYFSGKKN
jgi:hypothetical protein